MQEVASSSLASPTIFAGPRGALELLGGFLIWLFSNILRSQVRARATRGIIPRMRPEIGPCTPAFRQDVHVHPFLVPDLDSYIITY